MRLPLWFLCAAVLYNAAFISPLYAASCDDLVVDTANVFTDVGKLTSAARSLAGVGYDVRVRTFKDLSVSPNIDEMRKRIQLDCPAWLSGGVLRSRVFLLFYVDKTGDIGPYFGSALIPHEKKIYD